jgi:DNA repair exonuclease SbcCD nuclease subunit
MKLALITDTHYGVRNDNPALIANMNRSMDFFFAELKRREIDDIVHLGDLYDRHKYINYLTARACRESFLRPCGNSFRTHIIAGNHDEYFKDSHETCSLREMVAGKYATLNIYTTATHITIGGLKILLMPWITDSNREQALSMIKQSDARVVMGHLELAGFEMYRNVIKEHGDDAGIYSKFEAVYTGHFHQRSSIKNVHYIGAMAEYIWSDFECPRGFTILDTDTLDQEFVENPYKQFKQIRYDDTAALNLNYSEYKDTYVKVIVVKRDNAVYFDQVMEKLYDAEPIDVSIVEDVDSFIDLHADEAVDEAQDTTAILDTYISGLQLSVDNKRMQNYMREVYKEAITMEHVE